MRNKLRKQPMRKDRPTTNGIYGSIMLNSELGHQSANLIRVLFNRKRILIRSDAVRREAEGETFAAKKSPAPTLLES
jgi:hypothetical protein